MKQLLDSEIFQYEIAVVMFQKKYFNQKQPHEFYIWHNYPNRSAITLWWVFGCYNIILTLRWLFSGCELTCVRYLRVQHTLNVPCGGCFRGDELTMFQSSATLNVPCGGYFRSNNFTVNYFILKLLNLSESKNYFRDSQKDLTNISNFNIK